MVATRKPAKKAPAVVATIEKSEALALVKSGEVSRPNKFRRPCHLCGEIVPAGEGVLGGNKTEGWWASHKGGECFTPEPAKKTTRKRTTAAKESASKKVAAESESAAKVEEPSVPVRGGKRNSTMAAAKKTVARRTTRKAAPAPTATKRPAKRTAPKKVEPNKPVEVADESASDDDEGPEFAELDAAAQTLVNAFVERIKDGTLDGALGMLDDAIGERLDAVEAASKPAPKKTTARKSTTTAKSAADKVAPVKRAAKGSGSASASKPSDTEEVEVVKVPKPVRGRDYRINPRLKNKMAGIKITFKSYVPDTDNKKASIVIREEYNGKPAGTRFAVPTSSIVVDPEV